MRFHKTRSEDADFFCAWLRSNYWFVLIFIFEGEYIQLKEKDKIPDLNIIYHRNEFCTGDNLKGDDFRKIVFPIPLRKQLIKKASMIA